MDYRDRTRKTPRDFEFHKLFAQLPESNVKYLFIVFQKKANPRVWIEVKRTREYLRGDEVQVSISCNVMGEFCTAEDDAIMERAQGMEFSQLMRFIVLEHDFQLHSIFTNRKDAKGFKFVPKVLRLDLTNASIYYSEMKIF